PEEPYAILRHCWGANPKFLTLTSTNMVEPRQGIKVSLLPRNFQDAISICKQLRLPYIWIDSLCIVQSGEGSEED
ncbi:heterokaryon incompatibility, partial [Trematosphaeria pertusa]